MSIANLLNKLNLHTMGLEMRGTGKSDLSWEHISASLAGLSKEAYDFALAVYQHNNASSQALLVWLTNWVRSYMMANGIQPKCANTANGIALIVIYQHIVKSRICKQCKGLGKACVNGQLKQCDNCKGVGYHGASTDDKLKLGQLDIRRQSYEQKYLSIELLAKSKLLELDSIVLEHLASRLFGSQNDFLERA